MNEVKYLLKQNYCVLINIIKVGLVKYIFQTVGILISSVVFLFLINNYIHDLFIGLQLVENVDYFCLLKQTYTFIDFLFILITLFIMFSAYKNSESTWNRLKLYNISSDNIFIGYIILYFLIVIIILSFSIMCIFSSVKGNLLLSLVYILFIAIVLLGNLMLGTYIYKLINIKIQTRVSFFLASIIILLVIYFYNFVFFQYSLFKNTKIELCIFIIIPFVIGNILRCCVKKNNIKFFGEYKENKTTLNKMHLKIKNPYIFILVIEFFREWKRYWQVFIIPCILITVLRILKISISFEEYSWIFSTIATIPIGMYYSYNECHKINGSNHIVAIMTRILFSIILVFFSCFLYNFIGCEFNSLERYFECISYSIIVIYVLILLKCPMVIYGKDSPLFYVLIYLIPTIFQFLLSMLNDIVNSYFNIECNISAIHIMVFMVAFNIVLKGCEKNKFL